MSSRCRIAVVYHIQFVLYTELSIYLFMLAYSISYMMQPQEEALISAETCMASVPVRACRYTIAVKQQR